MVETQRIPLAMHTWSQSHFVGVLGYHLRDDPLIEDRIGRFVGSVRQRYAQSRQIGRSSPEPSRRGFRISIPAILHRFAAVCMPARGYGLRSEEHTSELQSLMRISYAVFCLNKKTKHPSSSLN